MKARTVENSDSRHGFISRVISKMAEFLERAACFRARDLYGKNNHIRMKAAVIFLSLALMLAGASFLPGNSHQAYSSSAAHKASVSIVADEVGLPNLQGEDAVEHLKKQGLYSSLAEAMTAARYKVYEDDRGKVDFYANNPAQRMSMRFDDGAMRLTVKQPLVSSNDRQGEDAKAKALRDSKPRYRTTEATLRLIGAGYGNRILTTTVEPEMRAEANRFTYHHQLRNSAISHQPSAIRDQLNHASRITHHASRITEWYINSASGIEHGFTLNSPPMERDGNDPLRVEMEFKGRFTIRAKEGGKGVVLIDGKGLAISYDRLKVTDAKGRELASAMKARGRRVSIEVADLDAEYPVTIDPVIDTEVRKIQASDRQANDNFGISVSISGDTAIVGASSEDTGGLNTGAAYIFERNVGGANNWGEVRKIQASDREANDIFGRSVSISGDTLVVGAPDEDTGGSAAGAAYLFTINCPPIISTQPISLQRDSTNAAATIASVTDDLTPAASLSVALESSPAGITVSNITNTNGTITADVAADCSAALGSNTVTLSVMDQHGLISMADLTITVTADTTPPVVTCPADIMVGTDKGQCSAVVNFSATANDNCDGAITPVCTPASGSTFSVGTTTVTCTATDTAGNTGECSFFVTVNDTDAPAVTCPSPVTVANDKGQCSAVVNFTATANDNCEGAITPSCNPPSGSSFPVGTTTVTCEATDSAGNTDSCMFTVSVSDTEAPSITCPLPPTRNNDPGQCSGVVNFLASARDNCDGAITTVCVPPSGSSFPVGITTVACMATDTAGNSSSCMFNVTVNDTQAPFIVCPGNITAIAPNPGSATVVVNYATPSVAAGTAGDNCGVASIVCNPPSGSAFPLGTTTVTCTVTDTSALSSQCSFTVSTFDVCIEDDSNPGSGIVFISTGPNKGDYRICCGGQTLTGRGTVSLKNGVLSLTHFHPTRRVQAYLFMNQQRGSASLQSPPTAFPCTISDSNTTNNSCSCSANP
ncbi:MAG: HYR domain-containing protein [Blastocatellia bacterium]|nr:HYR domain-containing protein [Blastocatellia bacterium]